MKYQIINKEDDEDIVEIVYNGKVYGEWYKYANVDSPEDLTLNRDLTYLINVGIDIGRQEKEQKFTVDEIRNYILKQDSMGDVMYNLSADNILEANRD